jgi:hypothetical protein
MVNMDDYEEQEGSGGEYWKPEEINEALEGKIIDYQSSSTFIDQNSGEEKEAGPIWTIQLEDGSIKKTPTHKMLQNKMEDMKIDDEVLIVFTESKPIPGRESEMKVYRVFKKK